MAEKVTAHAQSLPTDRSQRLCGLIAIETSGRTGSVAWCDGQHPPRLIELDPASRTTATLAPAIAELLADARALHRSVDMVAVASGPGSFTGVRIGVTSAKMLAYALGCRLVAVDTLAAMAGAVFRQRPNCQSVSVAINAYRQQLFVADWTRDQWTAAAEDNTLATRSRVSPVDQWPLPAAGRSDPVWAAEPAVVRSLRQTRSQEPVQGELPEIMSLWPSALDVAQLGRRLAESGHFISPLVLRPNYLRDSAAEEKLR